MLNHPSQQLANLVFERDGRFSVEKLTLWHARIVLVAVILEVRILPSDEANMLQVAESPFSLLPSVWKIGVWVCQTC